MRCQYCNKKLGFFHLRKTPFCSEEHEERYRAEMSGSGLSRLKEMFGPPDSAPRPSRPPGTPPPPVQAEPLKAPTRVALPAPEPPPEPTAPPVEAQRSLPAPAAPAPVSQPAAPPTAGFVVVKSRPLFGPQPSAAGESPVPFKPDVATVLPTASGGAVQPPKTEPGQSPKARMAPPAVQPKPTPKPSGVQDPVLSPPQIAPELPSTQEVVRPQDPAPERQPRTPIAPASAQTWRRLKPDGAAELVPTAKALEMPIGVKLADAQKPVPEPPAKADITLTPVQAKAADKPPTAVPVELTPEFTSPALPRTDPSGEADSEKLSTEEAIMRALFPHPAIGQQRPSPIPPPAVLDPFREDFAARRLATMFPVRAGTTVVRLTSGDPGSNDPHAFFTPPAAARVHPRWEPVPVPGNLFNDGPQTRPLPETPLRGPALREVSKAFTIAKAEVGVEWTPQPIEGVSVTAEASRTPAAHALRLRSPVPESLAALGLVQWPNYSSLWSVPAAQIKTAGAIAVESTTEIAPNARQLRSPIPEHLPTAGLARTTSLSSGSFVDLAPAKGHADAHAGEIPPRVPDVSYPTAEGAPESGIAVLSAFRTPLSPVSPQPTGSRILDPEEHEDEPILPSVVEISHLHRLTSAWARLASTHKPTVRTLAQTGSAASVPAELDPKLPENDVLAVRYPAADAAPENGLDISGTIRIAPLLAAPKSSDLQATDLAYTWRSPLMPGVAHPFARPRLGSMRPLSCRKHDSPISPLTQNRVVAAVVEVLGPEMPPAEARTLMLGPIAPTSWTVRTNVAWARILPDAIEARPPSFAVPLAEADPLELTVAACAAISFNPSGATLFIANRPPLQADPLRRRTLSNVVCALPPSEPSTRPFTEPGAQPHWEPAVPAKLKRVNKTFIRIRLALRAPAVPTLVPSVFRTTDLRLL